MPSKNRIAAYPPDHIHQKLKDFSKEHKISESKALTQILAEYFGVPTNVAQEVTHRYVTVAHFEKEVEELRELINELQGSLKSSPDAPVAEPEIKGQRDLFEEPGSESEIITSAKTNVGGLLAAHSHQELSGRLGKHKKFTIQQKNYYKDRPEKLQEKFRKLDPEGRAWRWDGSMKKWLNIDLKSDSLIQ